jgi:hypothetical protein
MVSPLPLFFLLQLLCAPLGERLLVMYVLETGQVFLDLPNGVLFIQIIHPSPRPFVTLCNKLISYSEEFTAPRPTP